MYIITTLLAGYIGIYIDVLFNISGWGSIFSVISLGVFILLQLKKKS